MNEDLEPYEEGAFSKIRSSLNPAHEVGPLELRDLLGDEYGTPELEYDEEMPSQSPLGLGGSSGMEPGFSAPPAGSAAPPFSNGMVPLDESGEISDPSMIKEDLREVLRQRSLARSQRAERYQKQMLSSNHPESDEPV